MSIEHRKYTPEVKEESESIPKSKHYQFIKTLNRLEKDDPNTYNEVLKKLDPIVKDFKMKLENFDLAVAKAMEDQNK